LQPKTSHKLATEIGAAKYDTAQDHDHHQVIDIHHDPPLAISISAIRALAGLDRQYRSAVPSGLIRPCNLKAERKRKPFQPLLLRVKARVRYWALGVVQATTLTGMNWLE
jgi:hypothetical protein